MGWGGHEPESYGEATRTRILSIAGNSNEPYDFAWTSGTVGDPKQIFYPGSRIQSLQETYIGQMLLAYHHLRLRRPVFYIMANMASDDSISNLLSRTPLPKFITRWILPSSVAYVPSVAQLLGRFSQSALQLALLLISEPTLIATVNPSSLFVLLETVRTEWSRIGQELSAILEEDCLREIRPRLGASFTSHEARVQGLLGRSCPPGVVDLLPELRAVYCWDGGYVKPFIDSLRDQFVEAPPSFFPMFSLSTETVCCEIFPRVTMDGGLPVYPGVCYEFVAAEREVTEANILKPWQLQAQSRYMMLVSDSYGLKRYRTEDIFECRGMINHTPMLRFMGRSGINYSFTGEKITDAQLLKLYKLVQDQGDLDEIIFTCFPKRNRGAIPGYVFVCCGRGGTKSLARIGDLFDQSLKQLNSEYASKRNSGRLVPPEVVKVDYATLSGKLLQSNPRYQDVSPSQFKLLPLYTVFWEDLDARPEKASNP